MPENMPNVLKRRVVIGPDWTLDDVLKYLTLSDIFEIGSDNEGQVIIYTGLYTEPNNGGLSILE